MRMGDTTKAIDGLNRVVNQNPGSVQGRLALAQAYATANDLQGAISTLDIIVDEEPRVARRWRSISSRRDLKGSGGRPTPRRSPCSR
jgi:predicted Zn-dependent protease